MGYPTSSSATARSRAATGHSKLPRLPASRPRASGPPLGRGRQAGRPVGTYRGPRIAPHALSEIAQKAALPLAETTGNTAWLQETALYGLKQAGKGLGGLLLWIALEQLARGLNQQVGRSGTTSPGEDWEWPDPAGYGTGSRVRLCAGTTPTDGPFPLGSTCGLILTVPLQYTPGISVKNEPNGTVTVSWGLRQRNNPGMTPGLGAVNADYYGLSPEDDPWSAAPRRVNIPNYRPHTKPDLDPWQNPALDPMVEPVVSPVIAPTPVPTPYRMIPKRTTNTYRSPQEQSQRGSPKKPYENPYERFRRIKKPRWDHREKGKERKGEIGGGREGAWVIGWAMAVTEFVDLIDAFWDALPGWNKSKWKDGRLIRPAAGPGLIHGYTEIGQKFLDLYRHWSTVDMERAIENIVINQIEDAIIGRMELIRDRMLARARVGKSDQFSLDWAEKAIARELPGYKRDKNGNIYMDRDAWEKDVAKAIRARIEDWVRDVVQPIPHHHPPGRRGGWVND